MLPAALLLATAIDGGAALRSLYTVVRRDSAGGLVAVPYHQAFADASRRAAAKLREAAGLAEDPGLRKYLELRAGALETDEYRPSDLAWMDMKRNTVDVVIGPIETYDDQLFGYDGDDFLNGGTQVVADSCDGGSGNDTYAGCETTVDIDIP